MKATENIVSSLAIPKHKMRFSHDVLMWFLRLCECQSISAKMVLAEGNSDATMRNQLNRKECRYERHSHLHGIRPRESHVDGFFSDMSTRPQNYGVVVAKADWLHLAAPSKRVPLPLLLPESIPETPKSHRRKWSKMVQVQLATSGLAHHGFCSVISVTFHATFKDACVIERRLERMSNIRV